MAAMTASRIRALGLLWATLAGAMLVAIPFLAALVALGIGTDTLFKAATAGVRGVSIPILERTMAGGLDLSIGYVLVNGTVISLLWLFVLRVRRRDPGLGKGFERRDPTLRVFRVVPAFRRIEKERLQPLFVGLVAVPYCAPALLGCVFAVVVLNGVQPEKLVATAIVAFGMLAPHGIFELTAVFLPLAVLLATYLDARAALEGGAEDSVWRTIRESTNLASIRAPMILSAVLVVTAAIVEAHVTMPIVEFLEASWS